MLGLNFGRFALNQQGYLTPEEVNQLSDEVKSGQRESLESIVQRSLNDRVTGKVRGLLGDMRDLTDTEAEACLPQWIAGAKGYRYFCCPDTFRKLGTAASCMLSLRNYAELRGSEQLLSHGLTIDDVRAFFDHRNLKPAAVELITWLQGASGNLRASTESGAVLSTWDEFVSNNKSTNDPTGSISTHLIALDVVGVKHPWELDCEPLDKTEGLTGVLLLYQPSRQTGGAIIATRSSTSLQAEFASLKEELSLDGDKFRTAHLQLVMLQKQRLLREGRFQDFGDQKFSFAYGLAIGSNGVLTRNSCSNVTLSGTRTLSPAQHRELFTLIRDTCYSELLED